MSALQDKYRPVLNIANEAGIKNLSVREQDGILYIDGTAPDAAAKQRVWDVYNTLNPNFQSADVIMNIKDGDEEYEVVAGDSLSKIGAKFGVDWKDIHEANKDKIKDPDKIQAGWKLKIPKK